MEAFTTLTAIAAPLLRDNIDTDAIIPSREMRSIGKTGLSDGLFAGWRYSEVGSRDLDPGFILNDPRFTASRILLSGANFGCGSSREHAAWALAEYGFRAVIAESFNPIFRANCVNNGIVPVELGHDAIARIAASLGDWPDERQVTVDLQQCSVTIAEGDCWHFRIEGEGRELLLSGMDTIEHTLRQRAAIDQARADDWLRRPWIYLRQKNRDPEKGPITT